MLCRFVRFFFHGVIEALGSCVVALIDILRPLLLRVEGTSCVIQVQLRWIDHIRTLVISLLAVMPLACEEARWKCLV